MKKIALICGVLLMCSVHAFGDVQVGVVASGDVVIANVEVQTRQTYGIVAVGGGFHYSSDDYTIGEGMLALRTERLLPGFRYGLGFKGFYGTVDEEKNRYDGTLAALGFLMEAEYELTSAFNPVEIPIDAYTAICFAPKPLAFEDTERLQEYKIGLRFYLLESAYISVEGKYRKIDFEDTQHGEWDRDDTIVSAGLSLRI